MQTIGEVLSRILFMFVIGYLIGFGLATAALWVVAQLKGL